MEEEEEPQEFDFGKKKKKKAKAARDSEDAGGAGDASAVMAAKKNPQFKTLTDALHAIDHAMCSQVMDSDITATLAGVCSEESFRAAPGATSALAPFGWAGSQFEGPLDRDRLRDLRKALDSVRDGLAVARVAALPVDSDAQGLVDAKGPVYSYDELLTRLYQIIGDKEMSTGKKYIMKPPQVVRVGSKKVGWINFSEICNIMKRPVPHVLDFVLAEFGTEGSIGGDGQLVLKGAYKEKHAESLLRKYIKEFVSCEMCKSANTTLLRDASTRLHVVNCQNCGATRTASSIKTGYHAVTRAARRAAKQKA